MDCPKVTIEAGDVIGSTVKLDRCDGKVVYSYRNVPYAKPPVGSLRFLPPEPADSWCGVKDCSVVGNMPLQSRKYEGMMGKITPQKWPICASDVVMDEDCLHLSIYTPHAEKGKKMPVMVWLYGGGFIMGSEIVFDGTALAGMNDVVVVVPNYRLGIFGFFTLGENSEVCPGNAGLWDQQMSLRWIQKNIENFGGDPENVTLFGESSGGAAVNHHVISPASRGLFHKAISQSGQSTMPRLLFSEKRTSRDRNALLEHLKIDQKDDRGILRALQDLPATDLLTAYDELSSKKVNFCPNIDGKFLVKSPKQCLLDADFAKVPYLMGCNNTEAYGLFAMMAGPAFATGLSEDQAKNAIFFPKNEEQFQSWKKFYVKDDSDELRFSKLFGNVIGDYMYLEPAVTTAKAHAEAGCDIYLFRGCFQLQYNHDSEYGKDVIKKVDWCRCDHGDTVPLMFGFPFTNGELPHGAKFTDEEAKLSREIMKYITNFAKHGDPNKRETVAKKWPKYQPKGKHLIWDHEFSTGENLDAERVEFWAKTFPAVQEEYPVDD